MTRLGEKLIAAAEEGVEIAKGNLLPAGTFRVADYRKAITSGLAMRVLIRQGCKDLDGVPFTEDDCIQIDHEPGLLHRPYDLDAEDFIPPQHSLDHLFARRKSSHLEKTTGRKEGATCTVTTRGSDVGEAARVRDIRHTQALHEVKMAVKRGDSAAIARLLQVEKKAKPKHSIPSRGFPKRQKRRFGG